MTHHEAPELSPPREQVARTLLDADTLTDLRGVVPREMVDAARDEASIPADDTDEG
jgi:hypothetical protein